MRLELGRKPPEHRRDRGGQDDRNVAKAIVRTWLTDGSLRGIASVPLAGE